MVICTTVAMHHTSPLVMPSFTQTNEPSPRKVFKGQAPAVTATSEILEP